MSSIFILVQPKPGLEPESCCHELARLAGLLGVSVHMVAGNESWTAYPGDNAERVGKSRTRGPDKAPQDEQPPLQDLDPEPQHDRRGHAAALRRSEPARKR